MRRLTLSLSLANFFAIKTGAFIYAGIGQAGASTNPAVIQGSHCPLANGARSGR
jgi:hypothetical protein